MTHTEQLLLESCRAAGIEFYIKVISPFVLSDKGGVAHDFIALFPNLGTEKGALVCHFDDWPTKNPIAAAYGYYCSGLHAGSYSQYDRSLWKDTLQEWGWCGSCEDRPMWWNN
jgi:hypothetical protein